jgi:hypothetical protein
MWTGSKHRAGEMLILLDLCGRTEVSRASVAALVETLWEPGVNVSLWEQGIRVSGNFLTNELYTGSLKFDGLTFCSCFYYAQLSNYYFNWGVRSAYQSRRAV